MGIAKRAAAAVVGLLLLLVVVGVLVLPRIIASEAVRDRIGTAMDEAVGREVRYAELDVGLFPPSLLIEEASVAGERPDAPKLAEAERVDLRVALAPLFAGVVLIDSLRVHGLRANLVRDAGGVRLPQRGGEATGASPAGGAAGVDVAIARFELEDAALILEDRSVTPAVTWDLREVQLVARGESLNEPVAFDLSLSMASGGRVAASGTATLDGDIEVEARLTDVAINPLSFYMEGGTGLAGQVTGTVTARGPAANPSSIAVDAVIAAAKLPLDDTVVRGPVKVAARIEQPVSSARGSFDLDATAAEVRYGDVFTKPAGETATVTGRIVDAGGGKLGLDDVRLAVKNFEATGQVRTGARTRIALDAPPFDLAGWGALVPALAAYQLSGPARVEKAVITTSPLDLRGALVLDGVAGVLPERGPVRIDGALVGEGAVVNSRDLRVVAADQPILADLSLRDLSGDLQYRARVRTEAADANQIVSTFTSKRDFLYGLLNLDGDVRGSLGGSVPATDTLNGRVLLDIDKGRMKGVSILQLTFDRLGSMGAVAALASALLGGPDLTPYFEDDFKEIRGTFDIADGVVRTDDMRIVYRDYTVDLRGDLRLADLGVDMTGSLTLGDRIEATLGRDGGPGTSDTIRLARVTGTLDEPKVAVSPEVAAAFLKKSRGSRAVDDAIDDAVGKEAGALIKGILGGNAPRR